MKGSNVTSTLDKYQRVQAPKESNENTSKNDIRITHKQRINGYIVYATNLLIKDKEDYVTLKAAGNAAPKGVLVAEILRNRVPGLHQINKIVNVEVVDKWIPLEEGLDTVIDTKILPVLEIKLTTKPSPEELKDPSYQAPLPADQVQEVDLESLQRGKRRGQPRGGEETKQGEGEGRPRGERNQGRRGGRGGRGGQRGGNNDDWENDDEVFKQDPPFSNRNDGPREGGQRRGQGNQGRRGYRGRGGNRGGNRGVRLGDSMGLREDNNYGGSKYQGDKYEDERYDDRDRRQGGGRRQGGNQGWDNRDLRRDDGYGRKAQGDAFRDEKRDNQGRGGDNQGRGGDRRQGGGRGNQGYQGNEGNRRPQTRRDDEGEWGDYDRPPRNQDRNRGQGYRDQRDQGDEREERGFRGAPRGRGRGRGRGGVGQNWVTKT